MDAENALMRLSDAIAAAYFHLARALEATLDSLRMIYDVRQSTSTTMPHRWRMRIICCA